MRPVTQHGEGALGGGPRTGSDQARSTTALSPEFVPPFEHREGRYLVRFALADWGASLRDWMKRLIAIRKSATLSSRNW